MNLFPRVFYPFILLMFIQNTSSAQGSLTERISKLSDSIKVGDLVIYNAFKHQFLAHDGDNYDSLIVIEKVYKPHPELWNKCLSQIFNGNIFSQAGIVQWNKTLFDKQKDLFLKIDTLSRINLDSLFTSHLRGLRDITGYNAKGKWILYAGPDENYSIFFGGCSSNGMSIDLAHSKLTESVLTEALPHEFEHMIFEDLKKADSDWNTALGATIDEGLASYYTYKYFNEKMPKRRVIEDMTESEFQWYIDHEKEIFEKSLGYLFNKSKDKTPYQCNCRAGGCTKLFDAPKTICYFLGFRIIEAYANKYGRDSWKDVYKIPLRDFFLKSGYANYIQSLK